MSDEQHRLECEARMWIARCQHNPRLITAQLAQLAKVRKAPQDKLRDEMRRQWKTQKQSAQVKAAK